MLDWFHSHSNLQVGGIILVFGLLMTTIAPYLVRKRFKLDPSEHTAKGAEESFKLFISLTLLLLAFCLVRMQGDHRGTEDMVSREGTVMIKLHRAYDSFGGENGAKLQEGLLKYANAVVTDEWPLLAHGNRNEKVNEALAFLARESKQLEPQTPAQQVARSEIIQSFNQLADLREARVSASRLKLPIYYWYAIICSIFFFTVFAWFQSPLPKLLTYVGGVTCGLCLLMTVLIATAGIFAGESSVTPEPIELAIEQMNKAPKAKL
jgi:hypothetical protein